MSGSSVSTGSVLGASTSVALLATTGTDLRVAIIAGISILITGIVVSIIIERIKAAKTGN